MELSRHARNRARLYGLDLIEVEALVANGTPMAVDEHGNSLLVATSADGREIIAVVALDKPGFVITLMERRTR